MNKIERLSERLRNLEWFEETYQCSRKPTIDRITKELEVARKKASLDQYKEYAQKLSEFRTNWE